MRINEVETGKSFTGLRAVLAGASIGSKGKRIWLNVSVKDGVDTIQGKIWDWPMVNKVPETKKVYLFNGRGDEYMGNRQLVIDDLTLDSDQDQTDFNACVNVNKDKLWDATMHLVGCIEHNGLRTFMRQLYNNNASDIKGATSAANNHHVGAYGNLQHCYEVAITGLAIRQSIYDSAETTGIKIPPISADLIIAGALCHDIGKVPVYSIEGPVIEYTMEGQLFDHIYAGCQIIRDAAKTYAPLAPPILELLEHIILSHHGKLEYGSPVTPRFIEAHIVAAADGISARTNAICTANEKANSNALTEKIYTEGNAIHLTQAEVSRRLEIK